PGWGAASPTGQRRCAEHPHRTGRGGGRPSVASLLGTRCGTCTFRAAAAMHKVPRQFLRLRTSTVFPEVFSNPGLERLGDDANGFLVAQFSDEVVGYACSDHPVHDNEPAAPL